MDTPLLTQIVADPTLATRLHTAAVEAAHANAEEWTTFVRPGDPWMGEDYEKDDDIHVGTIAAHLGRIEDEGLSDEEHALLWPVYRDAMRAEVERLLATAKGGA